MPESRPLIVCDAESGDVQACARWSADADVPAWDEAALEACLSDPNYRVIVAKRGEHPTERSIGFGLARVVADEFEVFVLSVSPEERRGGVGRALFGALWAAARRARVRRFMLEVNDRNRSARAFYRTMGLRETGRRLGYYAEGGDAISMERNVDPAAPLEVSAIAILAGGRGRRLGGVIKALLVRDGSTLLERAVNALRLSEGEGTAELVVAAPRDIAARFNAGPYRVVFDPGEGPAHALVEVAHQVSAGWVFAAAVDHVFWTSALVNELRWEAQAGIDAVLVSNDGVLQPFGALYRTEAIRAAAAHLTRGSLAMLRARMVVRVLDGGRLSDAVLRAFLDVDRPDDLVRLGVDAPTPCRRPGGD